MSISVAYAFTGEGDKTILQAFQASVRDTMVDIESSNQARCGGQGKNENGMRLNALMKRTGLSRFLRGAWNRDLE